MESFLDELGTSVDKIQRTFSAVDTQISGQMDVLDKKLTDITTNGNEFSSLELRDIQASLKEIEELIGVSKKMFIHIYENIVSSDLIDSELVQSCSQMLECIHLNLAEFISVFKSKMKFIEKIKLMMLQQEQKKELMELKHRHDIELAELKKKDAKGEAVDAEGLVSFNTDDVTKMLNDMSKSEEFDPLKEKEQDEDEEEKHGDA